MHYYIDVQRNLWSRLIPAETVSRPDLFSGFIPQARISVKACLRHVS